MPTIIYNNTNENNYNYDHNKIQIIGGVAKLLPISTPGEAYMYVTMDDNVADDVFRDLSGNSRDGVLKGGLSGSNNKVPAKINNGIKGISTTQGFVDFGTVDFNFERTDSFSMEFWLKTTSTATMSFMSKKNGVLPFDGYTINIVSGKIRFVIRDQSNNLIAKEHNLTVNNGNWHHVVGTYNGSNIITGMHLYVDNTENDNIIASDILSDTIINMVNFQISGVNGNNNCVDSNTIVDESVFYARELTAVEVAFRWNDGFGTQLLPGAGTSFPTDNPTIRPVVNIPVTELLNFDATIVETGFDEIRGVIVLNNFDYYWDGLNWVTSSGYSEANTIAEIIANISSLILTKKTLAQFKFYLHSDNGSTTPEISDFEFNFNSVFEDITLNETIIYSTLLDFNGNPKFGEIVKVKDGSLYGDNTTISSGFVTTNTLVDGTWEITLKYENEEPEFLIWEYDGKLIKTNFVAGARVSFGELTIIEECDAIS